jgi:hypothetical protein
MLSGISTEATCVSAIVARPRPLCRSKQQAAYPVVPWEYADHSALARQTRDAAVSTSPALGSALCVQTALGTNPKAKLPTESSLLGVPQGYVSSPDCCPRNNSSALSVYGQHVFCPAKTAFLVFSMAVATSSHFNSLFHTCTEFCSLVSTSAGIFCVYAASLYQALGLATA